MQLVMLYLYSGPAGIAFYNIAWKHHMRKSPSQIRKSCFMEEHLRSGINKVGEKTTLWSCRIELMWKALTRKLIHGEGNCKFCLCRWECCSLKAWHRRKPASELVVNSLNHCCLRVWCESGESAWRSCYIELVYGNKCFHLWVVKYYLLVYILKNKPSLDDTTWRDGVACLLLEVMWG